MDITSSLSVSLSLKSSNNNKLDYLYEVSIEPVNPTSLPLINPYSVFSKLASSSLRVVKSLIKYNVIFVLTFL